METSAPKHNSNTFLISLSRLLERFGYYGVRGLLVIYMTDTMLKIPKSEALSIYGWFTTSLVFSQIIGAVVGDLLTGNKNAMIAGISSQALGAFCLCIPNQVGLFVGMGLISLGGGLYTPNTIAFYGKSYLNSLKTLDAGFTIFYWAVNFGAFLSVIIVGYFATKFGWNFGFLFSGIIMLTSMIPIFFAKNAEIENKSLKVNSMPSRIIKIIIGLVVVGLFWSIYELAFNHRIDIQFVLTELNDNGISSVFIQTFESVALLIASIVLIIIWTFRYTSQFSKLFIGFFLAALSYAIMWFIPLTHEESHVILFLLSIILICVAEAYIAPMVHAILTRYSNPKYLAIMVSLAFIPNKLFLYIFGLSNEYFYEQSSYASLISIIISVNIGIGILIFYLLTKRKDELVKN